MKQLKTKVVTVTMSNRLYFDAEAVPEEVQDEIFDAFTYHNPDLHRMKALGFYTRGVPKYISTVNQQDDVIAVSRGCRKRLTDIFHAHNLPVKFIDQTFTEKRHAHLLPEEYADRLDASIAAEGWQLREDQLEVSRVIQEGGDLIVDAVCSAGKTEITLHAVSRKRQPTLVLVHTTDLLRQWLEVIEARFGLKAQEVGLLGDGKKRIAPLTIGMVKTVGNMLKKKDSKAAQLRKQFGMIVLDEGHHAPATTFTDTVEQFPARHRVAVTGSLKRRDGKTFLTHDLFGEVGAKITDEELIEIGAVLPVTVYCIKTDFYFDYRHRDLIAELEANGSFEKYYDAKVAANNEARAAKNLDAIETDYDELTPAEKRDLQREYLRKCEVDPAEFNDFLHKATRNRQRNNSIVNLVNMLTDRKESTLILSTRVKHCKVLKKKLALKGIEAGLLLGGKENQTETVRTKKRMKSGALLVGIGTSIADEALNIPRLTNVVLTCNGAKNEAKAKQQGGRTKRNFKGKKEARLFYIYDHLITAFKDDVKHLRKIFGNAEVYDLEGLKLGKKT